MTETANADQKTELGTLAGVKTQKSATAVVKTETGKEAAYVKTETANEVVLNEETKDQVVQSDETTNAEDKALLPLPQPHNTGFAGVVGFEESRAPTRSRAASA